MVVRKTHGFQALGRGAAGGEDAGVAEHAVQAQADPEGAVGRERGGA